MYVCMGGFKVLFVLQEAGSDGVMLAVVGNKEDLEDLRKVDLNEANSLAKVTCSFYFFLFQCMYVLVMGKQKENHYILH